MKRIFSIIFLSLSLQSLALAATSFSVGNLKYTINDATTVTCTGPVDKSVTSVVIPKSVTDPATTGMSYTVTSIGDGAFYNCNKLSTYTKVKDLSGSCNVYGVYPQYDNLIIDEEWLNDFGSRSLANANVEKPDRNPFTAIFKVGAGIRAWIYGPLSLECGMDYNRGLNNRLKSGSCEVGEVSPDKAIMTYSVTDGQSLKPLSSALSRSVISAATIHIALCLAF